jgi:hypothetical protein
MNMNPHDINQHDIKQGDIVRFTAAFLRSAGPDTPLIKGLVAGFLIQANKYPWAVVFWPGRAEADLIHPAHLEIDTGGAGGTTRSLLIRSAKSKFMEFKKLRKKMGWPASRIVGKLPRSKNPRSVTRQRPSVARSKGKPSGFARLANKLRK